MLRTRLVLFLVPVVLCLPLQALFADLIFLKNGETLRGRIVAQTPQSVRIETGGSSRVVPKTEIQRISFDPEEEKLWAEKLEQEKERESQTVALREELEGLRAQNVELQDRMDRINQNLSLYRSLSADAAWRSLIWPGWGQFHRGESTRGIIGMGVAGLLAYNIYRADRSYRSASNEFEQSANLSLLSAASGSPTTIASAFFLANESRNAKQRAASDANFAVALFAGWYLYNVLDAYFSGNQLIEDMLQRPLPVPQSTPTPEEPESLEPPAEGEETTPDESAPVPATEPAPSVEPAPASPPTDSGDQSYEGGGRGSARGRDLYLGIGASFVF
ncbi:MAG: hypothetical protein K1X75_12025 [Leptospirales bacterium]|nr:hypothetical protein [Leptospirales bacterium]